MYESSLRTGKMTRTTRNWAARITLVIMFVFVGVQGYVLTRAVDQEEAQRRRSQLIIYSMPQGIIMCGVDRKITVANPAIETILGWKPEDLVGKQIDLLLPESYQEKHRSHFQMSIERLQDAPRDWMVSRTGIEGSARFKDGDLVPVVVDVRGIRYGTSIEFIATIRRIEVVSETSETPLDFK